MDPSEIPEGFKPQLKTHGFKKYTGSSKFTDLETWTLTVAYRFSLMKLGGNNAGVDRTRVKFLIEFLEGDALTWLTCHVISPNRTVPNWTFKSVRALSGRKRVICRNQWSVGNHTG